MLKTLLLTVEWHAGFLIVMQRAGHVSPTALLSPYHASYMCVSMCVDIQMQHILMSVFPHGALSCWCTCQAGGISSWGLSCLCLPPFLVVVLRLQTLPLCVQTPHGFQGFELRAFCLHGKCFHPLSHLLRLPLCYASFKTLSVKMGTVETPTTSHE